MSLCAPLQSNASTNPETLEGVCEPINKRWQPEDIDAERFADDCGAAFFKVHREVVQFGSQTMLFGYAHDSGDASGADGSDISNITLSSLGVPLSSLSSATSPSGLTFQDSLTISTRRTLPQSSGGIRGNASVAVQDSLYLPKRYISGSCKMAIQMRKFFPRTDFYDEFKISNTAPIAKDTIDLSSFVDIRDVIARVQHKCFQEVAYLGTPGWGMVGNEFQIGVFVWGTDSAMDKEVPPDGPPEPILAGST